MPALLALVCALLALLPSTAALAGDPAPEVIARELRFAPSDDGSGFSLETRADDRDTIVSLTGVDEAGKSSRGTALEIYRGGEVWPFLAVRRDAVLVGLQSPTASGLRLVLLPYDAAGKGLGTPRRLDAPLGGRAVSAVVACPDPDGFTLLWQSLELQEGRPEARTTMARLGTDGRWIGAARTVDVPWALAALAHDGRGYHLALYFSGASPEQTRLSMVTLSPEGRPEQHPWWLSAPERIDEVQLLAAAGGIAAYWRGGPGGTSLRSVEVTSVGQWGVEPAPPRVHGTLAAEAPFALRRSATGQVKLVR